MKKLDNIKSFIAKNKPLVAVAIVATATVAAVAIDVIWRDNSPMFEDQLAELND